MVMVVLRDCLLDGSRNSSGCEQETPKAFTNSQPRVARAACYPGVAPHGFVPTLKGLRINIK